MQLVICSAGKGEERRCGQGRQIEEERRVAEVEEVEVMMRR
jgi:hypothetical protein